MNNIGKLIRAEASAINKVFMAHGIKAKAEHSSAINVSVGFIRYPLKVAPSEKYSKIESVNRELSAAIENVRLQFGFNKPVPVLPSSVFGGMRLEVPHPSPSPLLWSPRAVMKTPPHTMLLGKSYLSGPVIEKIDIDKTPHALVAGTTGAGKSVLLQTMLLSLAAGTSPSELQFVLVDLKNEDLIPFRNMPHVRMMAARRAEAIDAVRFVYDEKEKRVERYGYKPYRLVLVIDEMAQLASDREVVAMLGDLASIGRSKRINLIGATQHPTEKGGMGSLLKANFTVRLVGMVTPGQSYAATGRGELHADLLPGRGSFLRIEGSDAYRFQSYYIEPGDVAGMAKYIAKDIWGDPISSQPDMTGYRIQSQPDITGYGTGYDKSYTSEDRKKQQPDISGYDIRSMFPIRSSRPLTDDEAEAVRKMAASGDYTWRDELSYNRLSIAVYGSKDPKRIGYLRSVIDSDSKIIKLRKAG